MATESSNRDWPDDLLIEILVRLPVKAIIRFKCIGKTWRSLFETPSFVSQHRSISNKNSRFLICHAGTDANAGKVVMRLFSDRTLVSYQDLFPQMPQHIGYGYPVINVCDGLLCLCNSQSTIALWNPATREFRLLPQCNENISHIIDNCGQILGFGWDSLSNDYKVIYVSTYRDLEENTYKRHYAVYRMRTDSWRVLKGEDVEVVDNLGISFRNNNTCVNGVYYWTAFNLHHKVLAFHFGNEVFELIDWPTVPEPRYTDGELCGLPDDRISLWISNFDESGTSNDVWVLNNEGQYWTKLFRIGPFAGVFRMFGFFNKKIKDGVKVFVEAINGQLLLYDLDTQEFKDLNIILSTVWHLLEVYSYEESLAAVNKDRIQ
ncbi:F-box protein CPR30-like [Herrania umbratica]|uniref:F-box protein CPR30-like n=1 Tax=Herrania umbratica TaxID=108875 RepID=A0A6J1BCL9_9ROSI|nr:F-box protein CPR30-like [Herrania umbratica]